MPIGEFGGAAALPGDGSPFLSAPMYWFYEMGHAALTPARAFADAGRIFYKNPANPFAHTAAEDLPNGVWASGLVGFLKNMRPASAKARAGVNAAWPIS